MLHEFQLLVADLKGHRRSSALASARFFQAHPMGLPAAAGEIPLAGGTYDVDSDSCICVVGKDRDGKNVKFTALISVEDVEYPTQMIFDNEKGQESFFIWKRKE